MTRTPSGLAPPSSRRAPAGVGLTHGVWAAAAAHQRDDTFPTSYDVVFGRPAYRGDLPWNLDSNQEPSYPKAETLPLGHCDFPFGYKRRYSL
ncbi:hypothetical protein AVEN_27570-1 [Araneus ventricosus]|uniref:Uncharacterized protein n=1 Tax=Araneus ventricosus TaxID=182803 RepID=A0A4Y2QTN4_ARAVE|nr:hypothetical protein AVEN_27570-1 [Araneus ventricosus]